MLYDRHYVFLSHFYFCIYNFLLISSNFTFDNDGTRSSKRQVTFLSLIFLLKLFGAALKNICSDVLGKFGRFESSRVIVCLIRKL